MVRYQFIFSFRSQLLSVKLRIVTMAPAGKKRKADISFPDYVVKSLECPVCLETIKDPPIYLCEKGHGLCQTCREPLKAQDRPCPVCAAREGVRPLTACM